MAGYSPRPLADKLGLKDGQRAGWVGLPDTLGHLARSRAFSETAQADHADALPAGPLDVIHVFTMTRAALEDDLAAALPRLARDGMIWVSWPKKASKVPTDVTEDVVRALALAGPLVDVKVCAVDDIWSGLKLVIRKALR